MKLSAKEVRKLVKEEYSRAIPEFMVREAVESCVEDLKRMMVNHINTKSDSAKNRQKMIVKMNSTLENLEKELKDVIDENVSNFFNET